MRDHKAEPKRTRVNNIGGSNGGGYQCSSGHNDNDEREYKKPKLDWAEEKRARNRAKWEKRVEDKLTNKRDWHDPDMINWGAYCWTHGYNQIRRAHYSGNCGKMINNKERPDEGHIKTATRTNRK